jgi:glyoxylate reductase
MMKPGVFVTRPLPAAVLDLLAAHAELRVHSEDTAPASAEMAEACRDAEGVLVSGAHLGREVLEQAARLRAVSNVGVGYDNIDVEACTARRIPVTNTAGTLEETTADLAFALLMAVARRVVEGDRYVRERRWQRWEWGLLWGADIHSKTLGLYGFGRIGQAMARRGRGFGMRILYTSRRRVPETVERVLEAERVDPETLYRTSDFLSLHVPLTPETHHLVGAHALSLMKPTAFLINTARGKVVDEEALVQALAARQIAGAGLDVFEQEPQVHPALIAMPNVVLMPHVGSATAETRLRMAMVAGQNLLAMLDGQRPANVVNPEVYS